MEHQFLPENSNDAVFISFPSSSLEDIEARREYFVDDIAEWAKKRARKFGDLIIAKQMYVEFAGGEKHSVAWVEHSGQDPEDGETYHVHHIACDCTRYKDPDDIDDEMEFFGCPVMQNALEERAHFVDRTYRLHDTIKSYDDEALEDYEKSSEYHDIVLGTMEDILLWDRRQPQLWLANVMSGQHSAHLMGEILRQPVESVRLYADILQLNGKIEFDGETMRLTDDEEQGSKAA